MTAGNSFNSNSNFYAQDSVGFGSHLTGGNTGGYAYLAELMVKRLLRYTTSY
jgi:hypothetical protein